jgi:cysteine desulfurase
VTNPTAPGTGPAATYLDFGSTVPLRPEARAVLLEALDAGFGDPIGRHMHAARARRRWESAREELSGGLSCRADELILTSSGTAAVHAGLLGLLRGRTRISTAVAHSAVEHSSVIKAAQWWARVEQAALHVVPVTPSGRVDVEATAALLDGPLGVLAVQSANHEVATVQPIPEVAELAASAGVPLFVDAAASAGRLPLEGAWSAAAVSAHKWGGPAGVGGLIVRKGARWRAPFPTDERLDPHTSGFENIPAIAAAAAALSAALDEGAELARQHGLVDRVRREVPQLVADTEVVGADEARLPHLVTFSVLYVEGESLVQELARHGFSVASGSACAASTLEPSHVLAAMGALTHGNVRLSVGASTSEADIDRFLGVLPGVVEQLRGRLG